MYVSEILIIKNGAFPVFAKITGGAKTLVTELALVRFFSSVHSEQKKMNSNSVGSEKLLGLQIQFRIFLFKYSFP